jgi:hypothetical protein
VVKKESERETKIQYVYKHGSQTIVVDRPLTEEELSKLKFPLPNNSRAQQPQPQTPVHQVSILRDSVSAKFLTYNYGQNVIH